MKLREGADLIRFIRTISNCRGGVWYLSAEGDRLNLRSTLSQYLFAASSGNRQFLHGGTVQCEDPDDWAVLREFRE